MSNYITQIDINSSVHTCMTLGRKQNELRSGVFRDTPELISPPSIKDIKENLPAKTYYIPSLPTYDQNFREILVFGSGGCYICHGRVKSLSISRLCCAFSMVDLEFMPDCRTLRELKGRMNNIEIYPNGCSGLGLEIVPRSTKPSGKATDQRRFRF